MVQPMVNLTTVPGSLLVAMTNQRTGDLLLTLILIMFLLFIVCASFRMPLELSMVVMIPLIIASMALSADFFAIGGVAALYVGILFAKWFFIK